VRRLLANVVLILAALITGFGIGELAVRALYADQSTLFPRYHTDYRYGPYLLRGIRPNREFAYAKSAGVLRVLSLGDSHTQGYEVGQDATFSAVLERALRAQGVAAEVINSGVSGYSNAEALAFLENEGYRYQPDIVVLGFFANDFEDNVKAGLFEPSDDGGLAARRFEHVPGVAIQNAMYRLPGVRWLGENSYFYSLLFNEVWNYFKLRLAAQAARDSAARSPGGPAIDDAAEYARPTQASVPRYQLELATQLLMRMRSFCASRNIRLFVVDVPDYKDRFRSRPSIPASMLADLDAAGVEYVSSAALFATYEGSAEIHVAHGHHHISSFGHTLIGVELARRALAGRPAGVPR
jgi:lysophospholipase L1-like esterase